jgi:hypothetical protein
VDKPSLTKATRGIVIKEDVAELCILIGFPGVTHNSLLMRALLGHNPKMRNAEWHIINKHQ